MRYFTIVQTQEKFFKNVVYFLGLCNLLHKLGIALQLKVSRDATTI